MAEVHEAAAVGFERAADAYERGRPEYSTEAIEFVRAKLTEFRDARGLRVADVAAGTGKFTKVLASFPAELVDTITAVEPVSAMRTKCSDLLSATSRATVVDGVAERLPFADAELDVITVAQAFHWFDGSRALPEVHRVLRPGGLLLLIWNVRDESIPWVREMTDLMVPYEGTAPRYRSLQWRRAFDAEHQSATNVKPHFSPLAFSAFKHITRGSMDVMLDRVASVSFVASLQAADRTKLLGQMRELYERQLSGAADLAMPYESHIFTSVRMS
jgi:ubiquinone/menaquinone biosynthesis C-methylase UbiE